MRGFRGWLRHFMQGRYGTDKLSMTLLWIGVGACIVSIFMPFPVARLALTTLSYVLMFVAVFRSMSRNTYKRYQENVRYLAFLGRLKDRDHKYFRCPRCRQRVRVPRRKGKISISCPKCKEKFIRKT